MLMCKEMAIYLQAVFPSYFVLSQIFKTFYKRRQSRALLPPRLSFDDLEFYIDTWTEEKLMFSDVVPGPVLQKGTWTPPTGISDVLKFHLASPDYKMTLPMQPMFNNPLGQTVSVSVLEGRKDSKKVACNIKISVFDYIDHSTYRALAFDYLDFSPAHPFVSGIRAWISLLFMDHGNEGVIDVFGSKWISVMKPTQRTKFCGSLTCLIGSKYQLATNLVISVCLMVKVTYLVWLSCLIYIVCVVSPCKLVS